MCDHTEKHQEDGHRHHDHIVADAATDRDKSNYSLKKQTKTN